MQGPISIGADCIIEELAVIVNRTGEAIKMGDRNLFQVGCRIEACAVGSHNVFEVRSTVASNIGIGNFCNIGAGCTVFAQPISARDLATLLADDKDAEESTELQQQAEAPASTSANTESVREMLPDRTVVYGRDNKRRLWSGEGAQQLAGLHAKHLDYLQGSIPAAHKLKIVQAVRSDLT